MCGIFSYKGKNKSIDDLLNSIDLISYRGPDNSKYQNIDKDIFFAFHRLSIIGISESGNQPLKLKDDDSLSLICNGEIYNYKNLANKYNFKLTTGSDCEIILHMFKKFGIKKTVSA
jgi:asparagine synthase (glutamine-hydrolysing)